MRGDTGEKPRLTVFARISISLRKSLMMKIMRLFLVSARMSKEFKGEFERSRKKLQEKLEKELQRKQKRKNIESGRF